jgi:hypothetical protein
MPLPYVSCCQNQEEAYTALLVSIGTATLQLDFAHVKLSHQQPRYLDVCPAVQTMRHAEDS